MAGGVNHSMHITNIVNVSEVKDKNTGGLEGNHDLIDSGKGFIDKLTGGALGLSQREQQVTTIHAPIRWTPLIRAGTFFGVKVHDIGFTDEPGIKALGEHSALIQGMDKEDINGRKGYWIVDSGTTYSYAPRGAFNAMRESLRQFCAKGAPRCGQSAVVEGEGGKSTRVGAVPADFTVEQHYDKDVLARFVFRRDGNAAPSNSSSVSCPGDDPSMFSTFPVLKILLQGIDRPSDFSNTSSPADVDENSEWAYEILPQSYLVRTKKASDCSFVQFDVGMFQDPGGGLVGMNLMRWHDLIFDRTEKPHRLGIAMADCGSSELLEEPSTLCFMSYCVETDSWLFVFAAVFVALLIFILVYGIISRVRNRVYGGYEKMGGVDSDGRRRNGAPRRGEVDFYSDSGGEGHVNDLGEHYTDSPHGRQSRRAHLELDLDMAEEDHLDEGLGEAEEFLEHVDIPLNSPRGGVQRGGSAKGMRGTTGMGGGVSHRFVEGVDIDSPTHKMKDGTEVRIRTFHDEGYDVGPNPRKELFSIDSDDALQEAKDTLASLDR